MARWFFALGVLLALWLSPASALAVCELQGGDADGDLICDDGNGSLVVGDVPCTCQPGSPPTCILSCDDNCPWTANADQSDVGRVGAFDLPDRIGDACQCLDVSGDGKGNVLDATMLRQFVTNGAPPVPYPRKCPGIGAISCDTPDVVSLRNWLADIPPEPLNACGATGKCGNSADCPVGTGCNLAANQCAKFPGQACVQPNQCLDGACCNQLCTNLQNNPANCGSCGLMCNNAHGTTQCLGAQCMPSCSAGWGNCDFVGPNGCEQTLTTIQHCGGCNQPCNLPNAIETCATGTCQITSCNASFSNCDGNPVNGCELAHASAPTTCAANPFVGQYDGDRSCGFICGSNTGWDLFSTQTGNRAAWFNGRVYEDSDCATDIEHQIRLTPPAGTDYDLYVYRGCSLVGASTNGGSTPEIVTVIQGEDSGSDDSFYYQVEVRFFSGASCNNWTLQFYGHNC